MMSSNRSILRLNTVPVKGCPKLMFNGPCGGGSGNVCEVTRSKCPWIELFRRDSRNNLLTHIVLDGGFKVQDFSPRPRKPQSKLLKKLSDGKTVLTYEFVFGIKASQNSLGDSLHRLSTIYDAVNFIDTPLGLPHTDPLALAILAKNYGIEPVVQLSCKDKSRNYLVSYILALMLHEIPNMLAITGDWIHLGGDKSPRPVFDLDSIRLIYLARLMSDLGIDYRGRRIEGRRVIHVGAATNPYFDPFELEILRVRKKYLAGAEFLVTQPLFHTSVFRNFINALRENNINIPVIASIIFLKDKKILRLLEDFARVRVSKDYAEALSRGEDKLTNFIVNLAEELVVNGASGIHVLTMGNVEVALTLGKIIRERIL